MYECERPRRRVAQLDREIDELDQELHTITTELLPELLAECGVGPICADQLVVSSGDPTRMTSEASLAALADTTPVQASAPNDNSPATSTANYRPSQHWT